ncbi:YqjF family protein [Ferruginibacter sp.]
MGATFLTAEWNNLIMANYVVDPVVLKPYLPCKTELDVYNGNVYVSLVGFMFRNTKLLGFKIPFHVNFEEVNLRFYVRYNDNGNWKRGTVFIKEIVPKPAISFVANTVYREKYITRSMTHFYTEKENDISLGYHWKHAGKWNKLEALVANTPRPMQPGSEAAFIAEHYWGYSRYNDTTTFEYEVQHPSWNIFETKEYKIDCDFGALYGQEFAGLQKAQPQSVFVAEGSAIAVLKKRKL